ncbi:hypothetical protein C0431_15285 [bacterium]|nr:hypothetical protein [bacterium]
MRLVYCKLCRFADTFQDHGRTLVGLFDDIKPSGYPAQSPPLTVSLEIECEAAEAGRPMELEVVFIDEDGSALMNCKAQGTCPEPKLGFPGRMPLNIPFGQGMTVIPKSGAYRFDVLVNGVHLGHERLLFL